MAAGRSGSQSRAKQAGQVWWEREFQASPEVDGQRSVVHEVLEKVLGVFWMDPLMVLEIWRTLQKKKEVNGAKRRFLALAGSRGWNHEPTRRERDQNH